MESNLAKSTELGPDFLDFGARFAEKSEKL